jgi:hypothetical protein
MKGVVVGPPRGQAPSDGAPVLRLPRRWAFTGVAGIVPPIGYVLVDRAWGLRPAVIAGLTAP